MTCLFQLHPLPFDISLGGVVSVFRLKYSLLAYQYRRDIHYGLCR